MRTSDALVLVALLIAGGCDRAPTDPRVAAGAVAADATAAGRIACRLAGAGAYETVCTAERTQTAQGQLLTLRGPDGGFHRILVGADGRSVAAADGAEAAVVSMVGGSMEIAVAGDRYRLPTGSR